MATCNEPGTIWSPKAFQRTECRSRRAIPAAARPRFFLPLKNAAHALLVYAFLYAPVAVAATGMEWRHLAVEGLDELLGRGVYYGAGRSEAAQCSGENAVVIGAGNSAGQAVLHLARADARVTMLVRGDQLGLTMSEYLVRRIKTSPLIDVQFGTELQAVHAAGGRRSPSPHPDPGPPFGVQPLQNAREQRGKLRVPVTSSLRLRAADRSP